MGSGSPLRTQNLSCGYPNRTVLQGVDLAFRAGTVTAIVGPNGSGKSTLLKTLTGLLKPTGGDVFVGERALRQMPIRDIAVKIAVVPQDEQIPFRFTAHEIVLMGRTALSSGLADTPEDIRQAAEAMRFTDCIQFADRPVNELSGGERQRVLLARALAQEAEILVLDEPTTHLDLTHQIAFNKLCRELARQGKTVVAAMHDLSMVSLMADRTALVGEGKICLEGDTATVLTSPDLDRIYAVPFERIERGGRTIVLPPLD